MSHYDVLGVSDQSEYAIIRSKYRAAVLALHPDKAWSLWDRPAEDYEDGRSNQSAFDIVDGQVDSDEKDGVSSRFLRVQKAWEVLRNPDSRAAYDRTLLAERFASKLACLGGDLTTVIAEEICLGDMSLSVEDDGADDKSAEFTYPCRCGDHYVVSLTELFRVADELLYKGDVGERQQERRGNWVLDPAPTLKQLESGVSTGSSNSCPESYGGLVLPCQSCSLHVLLQDVIQIRDIDLKRKMGGNSGFPSCCFHGTSDSTASRDRFMKGGKTLCVAEETIGDTKAIAGMLSSEAKHSIRSFLELFVCFCGTNLTILRDVSLWVLKDVNSRGRIRFAMTFLGCFCNTGMFFQEGRAGAIGLLAMLT